MSALDVVGASIAITALLAGSPLRNGIVVFFAGLSVSRSGT